MVASESEKWRSNRCGERFGVIRPGLLRGESPRAFGSEESVADKGNRDVMMPARVPAPFVVVQPELSFEVLVRPLDLPTLFEKMNDVFFRQRCVERGDMKAIGRRFA